MNISGCTEAFSSVQQDSQTSKWCSYFENVLVTVYHKTIPLSCNLCHFLSFRDRIVEIISDFFIMKIINEGTLNGKGGVSCIVLLY